jgi:di/tricarboxylate transporter
LPNPDESAPTTPPKPFSIGPFNTRQLIAAAVFLLFAFYLATLTPTTEIAWVVALLLLTIYLFAFEVVGVDVAAITIMVALGLTSLLAPYMGLEQGLVDPDNLFRGFASNAVISIMAVMIIGAGLDKTGIMSRVASTILRVGGTREQRIIPIITGTVATISSFMQNVGAAALFIPVVSRICARTNLSLSRLLMPMGFCAILGGTMTMVGSSPLILLNDLILTSNRTLPAEHTMQTWSMFSVTPIGLALVATGIVYFMVAGKYLLPGKVTGDASSPTSTMQYFQNVYGLDYELFEVQVPSNSDLVGKHLDDVETAERIRVIAARAGDDVRIGPGGLSRDTGIGAGTSLGILASPSNLLAFVEKYKLELKSQIDVFAESLSAARSGIAEVVIRPGSQLIGKSARDVWMRNTYGIAMVALHRDGQTLREGEGIRDMPLKAGDTLVVHTTWDALHRIQRDPNFVVVTTEFPHEELRPKKVGWAATFFALALFLVLFTDLRLAIALLTGALGMVLSGVLKIEEAYRAVSWKSVFLLASLLPLGMAVESTGTARWIAENVLAVVGDMPGWVIQAAVATLATLFTLVMSNVGATVLLVPLAVNIAIGVDANPAIYALIVAIATSNSFLIPTHQVNALIMGPAGYTVPDFMRVGSILTILFLVVLITMVNLFY